MSDVRERLAECFRTVFPELSAHAVARATPLSVSGWDSVATLTLLTLVEEEFGVSVEYDRLDEMLSFEGILAHVERNSQP